VKRRTYDTPGAFKRALEDRLKAASSSGVDFARRRQLLVFDRFLARMVVTFGEAVMLKGGLVLELRLERARTTKDVDLRIAGASDDTLEHLQAAGALDLGDFMRFEVAPDPDTPEIVGDGVQYDGYRFRAECRLAEKVYASRHRLRPGRYRTRAWRNRTSCRGAPSRRSRRSSAPFWTRCSRPSATLGGIRGHGPGAVEIRFGVAHFKKASQVAIRRGSVRRT
jgi:hypothetical protein